MRVSRQQIELWLEAQYHYLESEQPGKAADMVDLLMEPLFRVGRYSELLAILEQTLKSGELSNSYLIFHARSLSALGRHDQALVELNAVEAEVKDQPEWRAAILIDKGNFLRRSDISRADEILGAFREAYEIYDYKIIPNAPSETHKRRGLRNKAKALFSEGTILQYFLSDPEEAMERYAHALEIFKDAPTRDEDGIAVTYKQIGEIYASKDSGRLYDRELAFKYFEDALKMFREQDSPTRILETIYQLGRISEPETATQIFQEYLQIAKGLGLAREEAVAKRHIAKLNVLLFEKATSPDEADTEKIRADVYDSSIALLNDAARTLQLYESDIWSRRTLANCYYTLGELWLKLDSTAKALDYFQKSLHVSNEPIFEDGSRGDIRRRLRAVLRILQLFYRKAQVDDARGLIAANEDAFFQLKLDYPAEERLDQLIIHLESKE
jgi:tetratricopeptide (TPR) repeat protein